MKLKLLAHRTGMANAPENSLEGFKHCYRYGASAVECDVTFIEGEPYVWAAGTDVAEPTFCVDDVLEFVSTHRGMTVYFDVKYYESHTAGHFYPVSDNIVNFVRERIIRPAKLRGLTHCIGFVTFAGGARLLKIAKLIDPNIATDLMVIFPWVRLKSSREYIDAVTIGWDASLGNHWKFFPGSLSAIVAEAKSLGIEVRGGLGNCQEDIDWFKEQGVEAIWTDDLPLASKYLAEPVQSAV